MRDIILIAMTVAMLVMLAVARPLGRLFGRWLERRDEVRLQRDLAEADAFHDRIFADPEWALAYVRQRFPEEYEMIAQIEKRAAIAAADAPWLPGDWLSSDAATWRSGREGTERV